jgi:hypothetical protein
MATNRGSGPARKNLVGKTHQERRKFSWRLFMDVTGSMSEKLQSDFRSTLEIGHHVNLASEEK